MNESDYDAAGKLFLELRALPSAEREARTRELQKTQPELAAQVRGLLESEKQADERCFLQPDSRLEPTRVGCLPDVGNSSETAAFPLKSSARYRLEGTVGQGGMGCVYRVFDEDLRRAVALKMLHSPGDESQRERFQREATYAASMQHKHIVPVYDVGEEDEFSFFTMALIEGRNLSEESGGRPLSSADAIKLMLSLADAVSYAHAKGVFHRDLKPANVLIDEQNRPWLTDFGIAKGVNDDQGQTKTGQVLGTAAYMSPEQVDGGAAIGPWTDVYGLGAILYFCLTGEAPFSGRNIVEILDDVRTRMPIFPRDKNPAANADLCRVCMRCLQKDPRDRYASPAALIDDLQRVQRNEPLSGAGDSLIASVTRVITHQENFDDLISAGATRWILLIGACQHLGLYAVILAAGDHALLWLIILLSLIAQGCVNYRFHWSQYWQLKPVERQSLFIQLSVGFSFLCLAFMYAPPTSTRPVGEFLAIYPPLMMIVGVATMAHSAVGAGMWMLSALVCFPTALLIHQFPIVGPPIFVALAGTLLIQVDRGIRSRDQTKQTARKQDEPIS